MCGISGVRVRNEGARAHGERAVSAMNAAQALRGPDDEGLWSGGKVQPTVFGHRRLSIVDLTADGHQPMQHKHLHITFNGEIYNYRELRDELARIGHQFVTHSDTEVVLVAYKEWGVDALLKLRGMFAFAIYDEVQDELVLARDRFGIKPLYFHSSADVFAFASTVGALKASGVVPVEEDARWRAAFLLFGYLPYPLTTLKHVQPLDAGSYLIWRNGETHIRRYFDCLALFERKKEISAPEAVRAVRAALEDAVRCHLVSDAPLGILLSGGLDSSVLAALAARDQKTPLRTLSIDFKEPVFSERRFREKLVARIGSAHRETLIAADDFFRAFHEMSRAMDQPSIDAVNTYFITKEARREGLATVLSGIGSDEIFFGYPQFQRARLLSAVQRLPACVRWLFCFASRIGRRYARVEYLSQEGALPRYLVVRGLFAPHEVSQMLGVTLHEINALLRMIEQENGVDDARLARVDPADAHSFMELTFYLKGQLLKDADFMSMHSSIEMRVPFLDHELVALLASFPPRLKFGAMRKELLIRATENLIPREVWDRPKMGFTFPFAEWLKKAPLSLVSDVPRALFEKFKAGGVHWSRFWALVVAKKITI